TQTLLDVGACLASAAPAVVGPLVQDIHATIDASGVDRTGAALRLAGLVVSDALSVADCARARALQAHLREGVGRSGGGSLHRAYGHNMQPPDPLHDSRSF